MQLTENISTISHPFWRCHHQRLSFAAIFDNDRLDIITFRSPHTLHRLALLFVSTVNQFSACKASQAGRSRESVFQKTLPGTLARGLDPDPIIELVALTTNATAFLPAPLIPANQWLVAPVDRLISPYKECSILAGCRVPLTCPVLTLLALPLTCVDSDGGIRRENEQQTNRCLARSVHGASKTSKARRRATASVGG